MVSGYDSWLADQQEAHDRPACAVCGDPTWRGDLTDGLCAGCVEAAVEDGAA